MEGNTLNMEVTKMTPGQIVNVSKSIVRDSIHKSWKSVPVKLLKLLHTDKFDGDVCEYWETERIDKKNLSINKKYLKRWFNITKGGN